MSREEALRTMRERRDYLKLRAEAKGSLGWENQYDRREHDALTWALSALEDPS